MRDARAPETTRIVRFGLVTADPAASASFFRRAFDASIVEQAAPDPAFARLLGVPGATIETTRLQIGSQAIDLLRFGPPGRPYPADGTSSDLWFQHFAIITSDIEAAYDRLQTTGRFTPISESGPETLPPASGSVKAFKFRDAEGHPLELLEFPAGEGPKVWRETREEGLFLGIDHSAVAIGDVETSIRFFETAFGLHVAARSENQGPEQARMDGVRDARVAVVGLMPQIAPPHVELLGYEVGSRRPIDRATRSDDIAATHFVLETPALDPIVEALTKLEARFVSPGVVTLADGSRAILVLDPDGHRFLVAERPQA